MNDTLKQLSLVEQPDALNYGGFKFVLLEQNDAAQPRRAAFMDPADAAWYVRTQPGAWRFRTAMDDEAANFQGWNHVVIDDSIEKPLELWEGHIAAFMSEEGRDAYLERKKSQSYTVVPCPDPNG